MKREARAHTKMKRLMRRLNLPLYGAMGIMETLWHVTAIEAWRGDIGKLTDEDIALALDWRGDEIELVQGLIDSGWLERHPAHRLLVHDWHEHADEAVQKRARRAERKGQTGFYGGKSRDVSGNVETEPEEDRSGPDNGGLPEPEPATRNQKPEPAAASRNVRLIKPPPKTEFPKSHEQLRERFPTASDVDVQDIIALSRNHFADLTDADLVSTIGVIVEPTHRKIVVLHKILPPYLERLKKAMARSAAEAQARCKLCGDQRKIFNPKFNGRPNSEWIDLPESEWRIACPDCGGEPASVPPGTAHARDPAHASGRRAAER